MVTILRKRGVIISFPFYLGSPCLRLLADCHSGSVSLFFNPRKRKIKKGGSNPYLYFKDKNTD
jgi:hypothetical protein